MSTLKMQHKPHDCRHTFISGMDSCGISAGSVILKRIVGHANADVTESYTHKKYPAAFNCNQQTKILICVLPESYKTL